MITFITVLTVFLSVGIVLSIYRILSGPTLPERTLAADVLIYQVIGFLILFSVAYRSELFFTAVLVLAMLIYLSTVMVARYMELTGER